MRVCKPVEVWALPCSCMWQVYYLGVERLPHPALPWIRFSQKKVDDMRTIVKMVMYSLWRGLWKNSISIDDCGVVVSIHQTILSPVLRWACVVARHVEGLFHPCNYQWVSFSFKNHWEVGWLVNFEANVLKGPFKLSTGPPSCPKKLIYKFWEGVHIRVGRHIFALSGQFPGFLWLHTCPSFL